jgi:hypothetical protein
MRRLERPWAQSVNRPYYKSCGCCGVCSVLLTTPRRWKPNVQMDANQNVSDAWAPGCKFGGAAALKIVLPGLKPMLICRLYAGVETPASLRFGSRPIRLARLRFGSPASDSARPPPIRLSSLRFGFFTELNPFSQWILRIAERKPEFNQIR